MNPPHQLLPLISSILLMMKIKNTNNTLPVITNESSFCYCKQPESGHMIACDHTDVVQNGSTCHVPD